MKNARRIFAIVSTTSIPKPAPMFPMEATVDPSSPGSRLDADHPENGVLIPCLFTVCSTAGDGPGLPSRAGSERRTSDDNRHLYFQRKSQIFGEDPASGTA